jgi:hypothetical protein
MHPRAYCGLESLKQTLRVCLRARFKINKSKTNCSKLFSSKAAEFSGVAGEFRYGFLVRPPMACLKGH